MIKVSDGLKENWEIIFIDDGSTDNSFAKIEKLTQKNSKIKAVRLRKNSDRSIAYSCGFHLASGNIIFTLDADLQDQSEDIPKFVAKLKKGYDAVSGWKVKRHDPLPRVIASRIFNFITSLLTGVKIHDFDCGFRAFRREVILGLNLYAIFIVLFPL